MRSTTRCVGQVPRPIGPTTVHRIHGTMKAALRSALKQELIGRDVSLGAELTQPQRRKVLPPDIAQFWHLLDLARDHLVRGRQAKMATKAEALVWKGRTAA
jgi:hypothetical protein